jgi:hypothetical protein
VPGNYCFTASWPGDTNYTGSGSTTTTNECFFVQQASSLTTLSTPMGPVAAPASVTDTATVSISPLSFPTAPTPTGDVQFTLCGPNADDSTSLNCSVFGSPVTISCPGSGSECTATSPAFSVTTSTAPGHYCWTAVYTSGDSNYTGSASTTTTNECFQVLPSQGCTPGFWGGGTGSFLWDETSDLVVQALIAASVTLASSPHATLWHPVFGLAPNPSDNLPDGATLFGTTPQGGQANGGDNAKVARFGTANLLNAAAQDAGLLPGFGLSVSDVIALVQAAWNGGDAQALTDLVTAANQECPF